MSTLKYWLLRCATAAIAMSSSAVAEPLNLGPIMLGMTNREVSKLVPLADCRPIGDKMVCSGQLRLRTFNENIRLSFDRKTKRLTKAELRLVDWRSDDARLARLYVDLGIRPCDKERLGAEPNWFSKELCFEAPNQVRMITWDGGARSRFGIRVRSIQVDIFTHSGMYDAFKKKKAILRAKLAQEKANRAFEQGK